MKDSNAIHDKEIKINSVSNYTPDEIEIEPLNINDM